MNGQFLISCIAIASIVFSSCGTKHADKPASQTDTTHVQAAAHPDTTLSVTALSAVYLDSAFLTDPKKAAKEYKGKTITVKGEIKAVHKNKSTKHKGLNWITLYTGSKAATSHLMCTSPDSLFVGDLRKGNHVTIKGVCVGTVGHNVHLKESEIVQ
jgi:hypothetical protein